MIIAFEMPDGVDAKHVHAFFRFLEERGAKLRPWIETFAATQAAAEGLSVEHSVISRIFDTVTAADHQMMAWPTMTDRVKAEARAFYTQEHGRGR